MLGSDLHNRGGVVLESFSVEQVHLESTLVFGRGDDVVVEVVVDEADCFDPVALLSSDSDIDL